VRHVSQPHLMIYLCRFSTTLSPLLSFYWVFFISSTSIIQMAKTRYCNANTENNAESKNAENNNVKNKNVANLPSPPSPTLEQVLVMEDQILQTM
jgi:hypothetical protein